MTTLENEIYNFPTKHPEGFTRPEIDALCKYLQIDRQELSEAIGVVTGMIKDGDMLIYHCDVYAGARQIKEGHKPSMGEWD